MTMYQDTLRKTNPSIKKCILKELVLHILVEKGKDWETKNLYLNYDTQCYTQNYLVH